MCDGDDDDDDKEDEDEIDDVDYYGVANTFNNDNECY